MMDYNNMSRSSSNTRYANSTGNNFNRGLRRDNGMQPIKPLFDIKDYDVVDAAEIVINSLKMNKEGKITLTTSQIRKFLTAVNVVRNKVDLYKSQNKGSRIMSEEIAAEVKFLKVNLLYQAGRESIVQRFMEKSQLDKIISDIGTDIAKFEKLCRYVEALVAFHKFNGGKDK